MLMHLKSSITQCGREITDQELDLILETVKMFPKLSQRDLAETICEHLGWYTASGRYKREACLKLLKKLEVGGALKLPEKRGRFSARTAGHRPNGQDSPQLLFYRKQPGGA